MSATQPTVREFMTPDPVTIDGGLTVNDAATRMFQINARHLPVFVGGHLVGILSDRDIARASASDNLEGGRGQTVEQACTPNPLVCSPDAPLVEVAHLLARRKIGAILVMEGGALLGMFTVVDALHALVRMLGGDPEHSIIYTTPITGDGVTATTPDARNEAQINAQSARSLSTNPSQGIRVNLDSGIDNPDLRSDAGKRSAIRRAATTVLGRDPDDDKSA
jgi:acetoin utilization protein AcuB